jgi:putative peptide zinc metalloprotease protein
MGSCLHTSRQVYQANPVYVLHDPVSFRSHRLNVFQYRILSALNPDANLGQNFQSLVDKQEFQAEEESEFYDLLTSFSRLNLIVMPKQNGAKLYEQHLKMKSARRRAKVLGFLFMQIPLVKPDAFLTRTVSRVSWLFTRTFFVFWLLGMAAAGFVIVSRFSDLVQPLNGILATKNLPFLWIAFVGLKIWHELGHGYACKVFGGFVPEMGTILIAGTPAAYVDASTAWSFPERYKRLVVMCGGMFFESLVFIPGVFIWAFSSSPMLSSCAYQLVIMASLVTLLFNANPLMKFDGYFIMSELIGIQNLRPKADAQIKSMLTSTFVGVRSRPNDDSLSTKTMLVIYGISATIYKFFLVISIAIMVAIKFPLVGLGLAAFHVTTSVGTGVFKMANYLLKSK